MLQQIVNYIIRPTRERYLPKRLGPHSYQVQSQKSQQYIKINRIDHHVHKKQNDVLELSLWLNQVANPNRCIIYLHANNGSRVQGLAYLPFLLENNFNVCLFDFVGSGRSTGQYVTLGLTESEDIQCVVDFLYKKYGITQTILWGRSMGAVSAIIYTSRHPQNIAGLILDSPFKDLKKLIMELASDKSGLPKFMFKPFAYLLDWQIQKKTGKSIYDLKIKNYLIQEAFHNIPALFLLSKNDKLVKCHHGQKLFSRYPSEMKQMYYIEIQHHQARQDIVKQKCLDFIQYSFGKRQEYQKLEKMKYQEELAKRKGNKLKLTSIHPSIHNNPELNQVPHLFYPQPFQKLKNLQKNQYNSQKLMRPTHYFQPKVYSPKNWTYSEHLARNRDNMHSPKPQQFIDRSMPAFQNKNQNYIPSEKTNHDRIHHEGKVSLSMHPPTTQKHFKNKKNLKWNDNQKIRLNRYKGNFYENSNYNRQTSF